jgi:chemotaxis signal transduction protein
MSATIDAPDRPAIGEGRFLLVGVGGERFALPLADVREAVDAPVVTALPLMPAGVVGQCEHRGSLLAVLDAGALLGVARAGGAGALLVMDAGATRFGLWVDDVLDAVAVEPARAHAVPTGSSAPGVLRAVLDLESGLAGLVDTDLVRGAAHARLTGERR